MSWTKSYGWLAPYKFLLNKRKRLTMGDMWKAKAKNSQSKMISWDSDCLQQLCFISSCKSVHEKLLSLQSFAPFKEVLMSLQLVQSMRNKMLKGVRGDRLENFDFSWKDTSWKGTCLKFKIRWRHGFIEGVFNNQGKIS